MDFSIIIPTCNRPDSLKASLEAIAVHQQPFRKASFEFIVTDDSHDAGCKDLVEKQFPWARWIPGPRRGPAANRNHGAQTATGQWLIFIDDDCLPDPTWLPTITAQCQDPTLDVIEGRTVCPDKRDDPFQEQIENTEGGLFWSCNLAVRRTSFIELGGFDEDFTEAGGEDLEFAWRIRHHELNCRFAPDALVLHPPRRVGWAKFWWRTLMLRWVLLYQIKTNQSPPLGSSALVVAWKVVRNHCLNLARTTSHLLTRFDPQSWRAPLVHHGWKWLSLPFVIPYLVTWEFRFRTILIKRRHPNPTSPGPQVPSAIGNRSHPIGNRPKGAITT